MKNFNDFLNSVDIETIYSDSTHAISKDTSMDEIITKTTVSFNIALLREYHNWLTSSN